MLIYSHAIWHCMAYFNIKNLKSNNLSLGRKNKIKIKDFKQKILKSKLKFQRNQTHKKTKGKGGDWKRNIKADIYKT